MAKKTRKVLKQESQQRALQQAVANVNAAEAVAVAAAPAAPARVTKVEATDEQDFAFVRSDVRRSLTLAGLFTVAMIVLSFIVR
jgi:hypothetical protein